jgi:hypothetical protein
MLFGFAGIRKRRAVESYREKKAQALRMHSSGVAIQQIAEQLDTEATCVCGWLKKSQENQRTRTWQ